MKIKVLVLSVVGFILSSCVAQDETFLDSPVVGVLPTAYSLEDDSGNVRGFATPISRRVWVTPDHLWQTSDGLYFRNKSIEVLARDFRRDLLFFKVEDLVFSSLPTWSDTPSGVGQTLAWNSVGRTHQAQVFSTRADFVLGEMVIEDAMQISALIDPGSSGKPLYDPKSNKIYGILMAADKLKNVSYFIRSDEILTLAKDYLNIVL